MSVQNKLADRIALVMVAHKCTAAEAVKIIRSRGGIEAAKAEYREATRVAERRKVYKQTKSEKQKQLSEMLEPIELFSKNK